MPPDPPEQQGPLPQGRKKKNLTDDERLVCLSMMVVLANNGKVQRGGLRSVSERTGVPRSVLKRLWRNSDATRAHGRVCAEDYLSRKKTNSGRDRVYNPEEFAEALKKLPLEEARKSERSVALHTGVPKTTVHRLFKGENKKESDHLRVYTSVLKPFLTEENKVTRLLYALDEIDMVSGQDENGLFSFKDQYDRIHIDEKWFFTTPQTRTFLTLASSGLSNHSLPMDQVLHCK